LAVIEREKYEKRKLSPPKKPKPSPFTTYNSPVVSTTLDNPKTSSVQNYSEVFNKNKAKLYNFAKQRLGPEDAEDVLQDLHVQMAKQGITIESNALGYLYQAIANMVNDKYRRNARRLRSVQPIAEVEDELNKGSPVTEETIENGNEKNRLDVIDQNAVPPDRKMEDQESQEIKRKKLYSAVENLPDNQRNVIALTYWGDDPENTRPMSNQEVAEKLAIPVNTVKTWLFQARKKLREQLGSGFDQ
jgi:RNA polymerase sigma factor (sigma-70 family)